MISASDLRCTLSLASLSPAMPALQWHMYSAVPFRFVTASAHVNREVCHKDCCQNAKVLRQKSAIVAVTLAWECCENAAGKRCESVARGLQDGFERAACGYLGAKCTSSKSSRRQETP